MGVWCHNAQRLRERGSEFAHIRADRHKLLRCPWLLDYPVTVRRQFDEPLVEDRPGPIAVWQDVACSVHLEARTRHLTRQIRTYWQSREQFTQWLDEQKHRIYCHIAQNGQLFVAFRPVNKIPDKHLQQHLVACIEQLRDPSRQRIRNQPEMARIAWRPNVGSRNGACGFKAWVLLLQLAVFLSNLQEFAVVRLVPIPARAFSLPAWMILALRSTAFSTLR